MLDQSLADELPQRIDQFTDFLRGQTYAQGSIKHYQQSCRHFVVWLQQNSTVAAAINEVAIEQFAVHRCRCPGHFVLNSRRNEQYLFHIRRFLRFLVSIGVVPDAAASRGVSQPDDLRAFRDWLRRHRGTGELSIQKYVGTLKTLLVKLGNDPSRYDAALINRVLLENLESTSRINAQYMCGTLRMYLRYLASTGACSPALIGAIPRIPRWRLATMPRYILKDDVERVIASCDSTTTRGLRDRAILLLLARLALRGGDVASLCLDDIDWDKALIRVAGKTRHAVALPLPQDVGDALLAYIERARPRTDTTKVFMRTIAPCRPFSCSSPISIIVREALKRAGVKNVNLRGAYLLRHSAATHMLRSGATLEEVGTLLRHRSPETTAIYAKVDTTMLACVAQPWMGVPHVNK